MKRLFAYILITPCIFKQVTHLYCPVCGGTRAMLAFLQGHFVESFFDNPIFLYLVVVTAWLMSGVILRKMKNPLGEKIHFQMRMLYTGLVLLVVIFVGRNIGVYCFGYDYLGDLLPYIRK